MSVNTIVLPKADNIYLSGSSSQLEALIPVFQPAYLLTSIIPLSMLQIHWAFFFFLVSGPPYSLLFQDCLRYYSFCFIAVINSLPCPNTLSLLLLDDSYSFLRSLLNALLQR